MKTARKVFRGALIAAAIGLSPLASAHSIALGTLNAGTPGSVTFWLGSYHTGAGNEGSLTIDSVTYAFNLTSTVLPTGLTLGTNYFYASGTSTAGQFNSTSNPCCAETAWQGVTATGLSAGDFSYTISGMNSVDWADWNTSQANWTGRVNVSQSAVNGVPEPASLALLGIALFGLCASRRKAA